MLQNPVATAFEIFWMLFEPILFGITGTQLKIDALNGGMVYTASACIVASVVVRAFITVLVGIGSRLNLKEKIFIAFACAAKATVQAALGPLVLDEVDQSNSDDKYRAQVVSMVCILSILWTAPTGAMIIILSGPKLLTKTTAPVTPSESGIRSRKPSIRDISIINEDPDLEERMDERKP